MKRLVVNGIILIIWIILFIVNFNVRNTTDVLASESVVANKNNALTMMLETDVDSNEYEVATSNEWPQEGYIFNAEMSACERGGSLSWDSENNRVVMASSKADKCYVYFDRYTTVSITSVVASNITNSSITLTVEAESGESQITTYYFSSNNGQSYESSSTNTFTFRNLSAGINYDFKVYVVDVNGVSSNVYSLSETTLSTVYFADYIKNTVYTGVDGDNGLYYHDGVGTYTNADQEAGDYSYRYSGANPNNYVCFGTDDANCTSFDFYRIIGVFGNQVKLIKNISLGDYYYTGSNTNYNYAWSSSTLNTSVLNGTYLNGLGTKWSDMIETTSWKVGGAAYSNISSSTVKTAYNYEVGSNSLNTTYNAKIGLMYVSDYGYAVNPIAWTLTLYNYGDNFMGPDSNAPENNWLLLGENENVITRQTDSSNRVFVIYDGGSVLNNNTYNNNATRPTFYLKSNVLYVSGDGSGGNPYRIAI